MTQQSMRIGLFYGSSTCYTEIAAEKISDYINAINGLELSLHDVAQVPVSEILDFDYLILGIPTWDYGELQEDWEVVWAELAELDLSGKKVALYGCGDQVGYPEWFQDAMGYLHDQVLAQGASICGHWPAAGYQFRSSTALTADKSHFVGLALDEENEFEASEQRIRDWCQQVLREFGAVNP